LKKGLDFAKALGIKFNLPVIPVNHIEAHVMTARMIEDQDKHMDFPFLSVLATGGHTEIVLTRGVGLHTVMGFTIDIGVGTFLDRTA
jgi:N6-L-threonylcarbamoyladenine synthase